MQASMQTLIIQGFLLQQAPSGAQIWVTLTPETAILTGYTQADLSKLTKAVKEHALNNWHYNNDDLQTIKIAKMDYAQDFKGSFIPEDQAEAFKIMKEILEPEVNRIFNSYDENFLLHGMTGDLTVRKGNNCLSSCYQFDVYDDDSDRLFTIKVYDKILDLVSRDGSQIVGSKVKAIVGSKKHLSSFNRKIQRAEGTGLTRLELSIHEDALTKYKMNEPSVKTKFFKRLAACMRHLTDAFLNEEEVLAQAYFKIPINILLHLLAQTPVNVLAIGKKECWIVNASTPHPRHFVGTRCATTLYEHPTELRNWDRLKEFVAKFASQGARVDVYWLHQGRPKLAKSGTLIKEGNARVSLPGCSQVFLNGVGLIPFINRPVDIEEAKATSFKTWITTVRGIADMIEQELARNPADHRPKRTQRATNQ